MEAQAFHLNTLSKRAPSVISSPFAAPNRMSARQEAPHLSASEEPIKEDHVVAVVRVPSPPNAGLHHAAPADRCTEGASTGTSKLKVYLLSPTTEMDIGEATYATAYSRVRSVEYLVSVAIALAVCACGFITLKHFCDARNYHYFHDLLQRSSVLGNLGSAGYDDKVDKQWTGFVIQGPKFVGVALLLGAGSALLRWVNAVGIAPSKPLASGAPLLADTADFRVATSNSEDERGKVTPLSAHRCAPVSILLHVCTLHAILLRLCCLVGRWWLVPAFYSIVGVIFVAIVHGPHFFLPLLLILTNYVVFTRVQRRCSYRVFMAIMWVTHVSLLYVIEICQGFEDVYWLQYYFPTSRQSSRRVLGPSMARDGKWRQRMRWYVAFRMTTLRLIAFNYDLWEATHGAARARERAAAKHDTTCIECAQLREHNNNSNTPSLPAEASRCYKYRTEYVRDPSDYNFINYLAYILFPPLYLAGPMSSFNAFVSYMRVPSVSMPPYEMAVYALRILGIFATEFVLMHFVHVTAIGKYTRLILEMTLVEQAFYLYYTLAYLWLKFSFIWKTSRLFAMFSGIEVPEDMRRCFSNSFSVRDFWRDWHASFNLWIVRYMYIPMGGRSRVALSVLPIFLFIAIWHDPALHLLKWALCIAVMFVIELVVSACFGWVSGVFTREMAAAGTARAAHDEDVEEGEAQGDTHSSQRSSGGAVTALLRPPARFATRHLSPRVRAWCYRMLRVLAGMSTVFGLIVANLVGFSMQNSAATFGKSGPTSAETEADRVITRAFGKVTIGFSLCVALFMYSGSSLAVIDRDFVMHQTRWLKQKYGLQ